LYFNLKSNELPVRVQAALSLNSLLNHELAVKFMGPGLEPVIKTYLKIMDDMDFDELVKAL
jgi:hypothetical protein